MKNIGKTIFLMEFQCLTSPSLSLRQCRKSTDQFHFIQITQTISMYINLWCFGHEAPVGIIKWICTLKKPWKSRFSDLLITAEKSCDQQKPDLINLRCGSKGCPLLRSEREKTRSTKTSSKRCARVDREDRGDRGDRETYCPVSILLIMQMQFQPLLLPFFSLHSLHL